MPSALIGQPIPPKHGDALARASRTKTTLGSAAIRAFAVCPLPSGPQVFVAVDGDSETSVIVSLDLESGRELTRMTCGPGVITALAASNDGRWLVTRTTETVSRLNAEPTDQLPADSDRQSAFDVVRVWDWSRQTERFRFGPYTPGSRALAVSADARRALTIAEPSIGPRTELPQDAVWLDLTTGQEICRLHTGSKTLTAVALSPTATRAALADADGRVVFCDLPK